MSDAHNEHQSPIRTPKQLIAAVAGFFLVIVIGIILLVQFVTTDKLTGEGSASQTSEAIAARLQPVADEGYTVKVATAAPKGEASASTEVQSGETIYAATCAACHDTGVTGAPKLGDAGAWSARIAQGYDTLLKHATEGIRMMPAKGGNPDLADADLARAVVYLANKGGATFKEAAGAAPAAPAAPAPAGAATPAGAPATAAPAPAASAAPDAAAPAKLAADAGKTVYMASCQACHGAGIAGSPKFGDKAAWSDRIKQGTATLQEHAIKGFKGMPAKGGSAASDDEVKAAVEYMVAAAK